MKFACVVTTVNTLAAARKLAQKILKARLAACVQLIPMESHYVWKGRSERASEIQIVMKTRADAFKKIETFVKKNHPYETPELIQIPIPRGAKSYFDWIAAAVK